MGDVTLENFLYTHDLVPESLGADTKVLVARFDDVPYDHYLTTVAALRDAGVTASVYLGTKKFGKQIDFAVKEAYTHVLIIGGDEYARGTVKVKNLLTREETEAPLADIIADVLANS